MVGLKIYNSTVISWDETAALTSTHHKSMRSLLLVRVYFPAGDLPAGLLTDDFPQSLAEVVACVTNIHVLPVDLDTKWPQELQLILEFSPITSVPDALIRLRPSLVSFAGCPITSVPAELFEIQSLMIVMLGMTRVQELSRNVTHVSQHLIGCFLQHTNVTTFWSWMDAFVDFQLMVPKKLFKAFNTPYCRQLEEIRAGERGDFSVTRTSDLAKIMDTSTPEKRAYTKRAVDCSPGPVSHFPLAIEDAMHSLQ